MPTIECPVCGATFELSEDEFEGEAECPECGTPLYVIIEGGSVQLVEIQEEEEVEFEEWEEEDLEEFEELELEELEEGIELELEEFEDELRNVGNVKSINVEETESEETDIEVVFQE